MGLTNMSNKQINTAKSLCASGCTVQVPGLLCWKKEGSCCNQQTTKKVLWLLAEKSLFGLWTSRELTTASGEPSQHKLWAEVRGRVTERGHAWPVLLIHNLGPFHK